MANNGFQRMTEANGQISWKCNVCGILQRNRRAHVCNYTPRPPGDEEDEGQGSVDRFFAAVHQSGIQTTPFVTRPPRPEQPRVQATPFTTMPPHTATSAPPMIRPLVGNGLDMSQFLQYLQQQQEQSQLNFQKQLEAQQQRDKQMFDMMMNTQKDFMKSVENRLKKDDESNNSSCGSSKKAKCPKWDTNESLESFCDRLKIWNRVDTKNKNKYLELIDSLQESGKTKEKERCILEVRNGLLEADDVDIIPKMIKNLQKWFGKSKLMPAQDPFQEH